MSERHQILNEREFWTRLEYDACRWLESSDDRTLRRFWIDGFLPETIRNTRRGLDVEGMVWVGDGPRTQHQYRFIVSVPQKMLSRQRESFSIERFSFDELEQMLQIALVSSKPIAESDGAANGSQPVRS